MLHIYIYVYIYISVWCFLVDLKFSGFGVFGFSGLAVADYGFSHRCNLPGDKPQGLAVIEIHWNG